MALILTQTDTVAPCGTILACTSPEDGLAVTPQARKAEGGGSAGSGELSVEIYKAAIQAGVMFESPAVGETTWDSGTYTVRLNVTTAVADLNLIEVHVCRVNSSCASQATVGSTTGLSISMGTTGVKQVDVTGAQQSAVSTDRIYIVLIFQQTSHANATFGFTPDQDIDTPIVPAGQDYVKVIDETLQSIEGKLSPRTMKRILNETLQSVEGELRARTMKRILGETLQLNEGKMTASDFIRVIDEALQAVEGKIPRRDMVRIKGKMP